MREKRTAQEPGFRMEQGRFDRTVEHDRGSGKEGGVAFPDQAVHRFLEIGTGRNDKSTCFQLSLQLFLRFETAEIVPVIPGGVLNRPIKQESGFHLSGTEQAGNGRYSWDGVGPLHDQVDSAVIVLELPRHQTNPFSGFGKIVIPDFQIAEGCQKDQECVAGGEPVFLRQHGFVGFGKIMKDLSQREDFIFGPFFSGSHARKGEQFLIGTGPGKENGIQAGLLCEVAVFIISDDLGILCFRRDDAGDVRFDIPGTHGFGDRYAFVAFNDVVVSHIFEGCDRLVYAFGLHAFIEMIPFCGKLAAAFEDGQEAFGECLRAPGRNGTQHPGEGNRDDAQRHPGEGGQVRNFGFQDRQERILMRLQCRCIDSKPFTAGFSVMIHLNPPKKSLLVFRRDGTHFWNPAKLCCVRENLLNSFYSTRFRRRMQGRETNDLCVRCGNVRDLSYLG